MSIVTKGGDQGETSLFGGQRVPKHDLRVAAYGEVDELNSAIGVLLAEDLPADIKTELYAIQEACFVIGGELAIPPLADQKLKSYVPKLESRAVVVLEASLKSKESVILPQQKFILPGGTREAALAFWVRSVCRRVERSVAALAKGSEVNPVIGQYLNRLSDYFFILGRWFNRQAGVEETEWAGGEEGIF